MLSGLSKYQVDIARSTLTKSGILVPKINCTDRRLVTWLNNQSAKNLGDWIQLNSFQTKRGIVLLCAALRGEYEVLDSVLVANIRWHPVDDA